MLLAKPDWFSKVCRSFRLRIKRAGRPLVTDWEGIGRTMAFIKKLDANHFKLTDQVVSINRVTKVVKGGKNMSFAALVVVGDATAGVVGHGAGKAKEVPQAIRKAIESAKKNLVKVNLTT